MNGLEPERCIALAHMVGHRKQIYLYVSPHSDLDFLYFLLLSKAISQVIPKWRPRRDSNTRPMI